MRIPPHAFFLVSAVFRYLGPAFAVLLFRHVDVLGVAWLRIASAALVFALLLALPPATASCIGVLVLGQVPSAPEALGVVLVVLGVAMRRDDPGSRRMANDAALVPLTAERLLGIAEGGGDAS